MDLVPDAKAKEQLHQVISGLNASAEVHETKFCHLHLEHILGRGILHNPGANGNLLSPGGTCSACWHWAALAAALATCSAGKLP